MKSDCLIILFLCLSKAKKVNVIGEIYDTKIYKQKAICLF